MRSEPVLAAFPPTMLRDAVERSANIGFSFSSLCPSLHAMTELRETSPPATLSARAAAQRPTPYLDGLNDAQMSAVYALDGPVLMLAGAGTGKTRALTARIAHLLAQGKARPNEVLAVTFTNKAAREMRDRLGRMMGEAVEGMPWLGTFHAICVKLLRRHAELVVSSESDPLLEGATREIHLKSNFTILDTDDQLRLLKQLVAAAGVEEKRWPPRMLAGIIDRWKNRAWTPDTVPAHEAGGL